MEYRSDNAQCAALHSRSNGIITQRRVKDSDSFTDLLCYNEPLFNNKPQRRKLMTRPACRLTPTGLVRY